MQNIPNKIFICGFMGAGKTTVSQELAKKFNFYFFDLDEQIEIKAELSIPKIFKNFGEDKFRGIEKNTLEEIIWKNEKFVLALGGGTLDNSENLKLVQSSGSLVFLENSFENLWERIKLSNRPLVKKGENYCLKLFLQRQESYSNSSTKINCNQKSVSETVIEVYNTLTTK